MGWWRAGFKTMGCITTRVPMLRSWILARFVLKLKKFWLNHFSFNLKNRLFCLDIDSWKYSRTNQKIGQILHHLWTWQHISMPAHQTPFRERLKSCYKNHQINIIFWRIRKRKKSLNQWSAHVLLEVLQQMIWLPVLHAASTMIPQTQ